MLLTNIYKRIPIGRSHWYSPPEELFNMTETLMSFLGNDLSPIQPGWYGIWPLPYQQFNRTRISLTPNQGAFQLPV